MSDAIHFIKCQYTILLNWLPIYQLLFFIYLGIPIYFVSFLKNKNPKVNPFFLSLFLLVIWVVQMVILEKWLNLYYDINI